MKIEKLNENQLKITLAPEDLNIRGMAISELSYGSPKTKELYDELVNQALSEFGFEDEDGALVIEAVPTSIGNLIIFITKSHDSEDLDARFSRFSPDLYSIPDDDGSDFIPLTDMIKAPKTNRNKDKRDNKNKISETASSEGKSKIYVFSSLEAVTELSVYIKDGFSGKSSLYKNPRTKLYFLILENYPSDKTNFGKICNIASEFSTQSQSNYATKSVIMEHCEKIIDSDAISILASLS